MHANWQNITDPIFHWAEQRPDAPAFIQPPETLSYRALAGLIAKAAVYLEGGGVRSGDRVALHLTNAIDHFILLLALLRLGATTMEIPYSAQQPPTPELLAKFGIKWIFIEAAAAPVAGVSSIKIDASWRSMIARRSGDRRASDNGNGIFTITLTSGTSGQPKGSLASHRQHLQRFGTHLELLADSALFSEQPPNFLLIGPIAYAMFLPSLLNQLFAGAPLTILPTYLDTIDLVKAIGAWDGAHCRVTSAFCRYFLSCAPKQGVLFPHLRALGTGGGFLYPEEKLAILDRVTPNFYEVYGASGFGAMTVLTPREMRTHPQSVGRPASFVTVEVVDQAGRKLPSGTVGLLRCRGTEGKGFTAEVASDSDEHFRDGWYYPGDLACLDQDGFVYLKGRSGTEVISRDGIELFAAEIEAVIAQHASVAEVAIVGVPRAVAGEELVALVVPRGQAQHEALAQHCVSRLPVERRPDTVYYANALPKTGAGKLDRASVKAIVMDQVRRRIGS
ncbi:MAG TPA: class I adenylate-forming enzyme family protein [Bradyrhizobium sp.]|uniref:class I adenylate-forming enzyme family protein n=1 Tax=Bradyrhizobium sp. TaxID=376 RepID=UPI002C2D6AFA|nr:class I adenylate-forming enzyme family protein [Bradyrhizobium sp.]HLZ06410.1 class I adenylate-forming enzyme family protein [Bradyrhizobium sp.]